MDVKHRSVELLLTLLQCITSYATGALVVTLILIQETFFASKCMDGQSNTTTCILQGYLLLYFACYILPAAGPFTVVAAVSKSKVEVSLAGRSGPLGISSPL